ncbi:metadherin a [Denticeps clupeoides]|uniref:LYRIC protein n=1 Tax=Denticeps clupeoides TaxID=299321 RepID=A0AAY4EHL6_9TELE|nr:protein LYRIC-like [Denticeps clupeoides]
MAADWQGLASQQAELIASRLREIISSGLKHLNSEFGLEVDFRAELCPSWAILSTALVGLLLVVALTWAAACSGGGLFGGRKRPAVVAENRRDSIKVPEIKAAKAEEPKKKNKKKSAEKRPQPNGRTVPEIQEEAKVTAETPKPQPEVKAEKIKKTKKKPKADVKQTQGTTSADGREPDEGTWETKISNREKRQQRRKDKGPNDGSPGGVNSVGHQVEQPPLSTPVKTKKKKDPGHAKAGKADAALPQANWNDVPSVNGGGWNESTVKLSSKAPKGDGEKWSGLVKMSGHRNPDPMHWAQDADGGSWTSVDRRTKAEVNSVLRLKPSGGELAPKPVPVTQLTMNVDNEWSGFNGLGAADPSSDWNAPTELWGNYEEPQGTAPLLQTALLNQMVQESDDDKEKGDSVAGGSGKSKKKKKKKKPEKEDGANQDNPLVKPQTHVPLPVPVTAAAKQGIPASSQKKPEQNKEPPKPQVQKKKARRET